MGFRSVVAVAAFLGFVGPSSAADYRALSSWDQSYPARTMLFDKFLKNLETASKGEMKFIVSGPETVPSFEQLQPVGAGAFQLLFTHGAYHFGTTPYLTALEGLTGDLAKWREAGIHDLVDKHYQRFGLKLIALAQSPEGGYHIILRAPVGPSGDLHGRKIRGTQTYASVLQMLGASPVVLPPNEIYPSLEKGVVDGAAWPVIGALGYRWYEVAKYPLRPSFGTVAQVIFMNLNTWNRLPDAQKKIVTEEARKIEDEWFGEWTRLAKEEEDALIARGAQLTEMGPEQKAKLQKAWSDGLIALGMPKNPQAIGELQQLGKSKGMLP
jgi:TRAP-type transport system periplasmic protein